MEFLWYEAVIEKDGVGTAVLIPEGSIEEYRKLGYRIFKHFREEVLNKEETHE